MQPLLVNPSLLGRRVQITGAGDLSGVDFIGTLELISYDARGDLVFSVLDEASGRLRSYIVWKVIVKFL